MKILAIEVECPHTHPEQMQAYLMSEAAKVWELYQKEIIREAYFEKDHHSAVLIFECENLSEAQAVVRSLPLVEAGLNDFNLLPLIPYDGFARLFA